MTRRAWFWVGLALLSAACVLFAVANFSRAFPIVTLDLEMSRQEALAKAAALADRYGWGPADRRQAASFELDRRVQSFVELEGGGMEAFGRMLTEGLYSPYTWRVRHFAEFETNETTISFTPAGEPFGFSEKIPEDEEGAALESDQARSIAEAAAAGGWGIDLDEFELVEDALEVRPSGRVDHSFTYERPSPTIGAEGRYRLMLTISGDRFTGLKPFVKVPEAFDRRYEEMRSANNSIATAAMVAAALLYVIGGCVIGLYMLLRKRWVLWKTALFWGAFVALLQALVALNQWPLVWMSYDTAVSAANFTLQQLVQAVGVFIGMGVLLSLSFMAAESLTRRAFPNHIQLWRVWSPGVAETPAVAGRTVAGYLLVAVFFAFDVALYLFASRTLGWWNPSDALYDPNVIATYLPWLTSVAVSLQAGFWEECLFRAIPIASAALLGERFGGRRWWILGALLLQAVVFGAGHANYPAQPAYARLVELIIPAIGFGLLYIVFGLLPAIILHFAFDVMWFAIPVFVASSSGIWLDRALIILLALTPLWVVLWRRWRAGAWRALPEEERNAGWVPPPAPAEAPPPVTAVATGLDSRARLAIVAAGVVGLALWFASADFTSDVPALDVGRSAAESTANAELAARGVEIPNSWRRLSTVDGVPGLEDRFVWQEGGVDAYRDLLGTYLAPPYWMVRYASFEGDVVERAEEYRLEIGPDGLVERVTHQLPESRPGAALDVDQARGIARAAIEQQLGIDPAELDEVSAEPQQHPDRVDWRFVFSDDASYPLEQGDARIAVQLAGDKVSDAYRFVHVPEQWERDERNRSSATQLVQIVSIVAAILIFLAAAIAGIVRWSRGRFATGTFLMSATALVVLGLVGLANRWPSITAMFSTAQPFKLQAAMVVAGGALVLVATATGVALAIGFVHRWVARQPSPVSGLDLAAGVGLGAALAGVAAILSRTAASLDPTWPAFDAAGATWPYLAAALGPISGWISGTALLLLIVAAADRLSSGWTRRRPVLVPVLLAAGLVVAGTAAPESVARWLGAGVATGVLLLLAYVMVLRRQVALLPVAAAAMTFLSVLRQGTFRAFPGALAGSLTAAVVIVVLGVIWSRRLTAESRVEVEAPALDEE